MRRSGRSVRVSATRALTVAACLGSRLPWARVMRAGAVMVIRLPSSSCVGRRRRWRRPRQWCGAGGLSLVDAALGLVAADPAAAAGVLTLGDALRAGPAPDGRIAVVLERVDEDAVLGDVLLHVLVRPPRQRRDLDLLLLLVPADDRGDHAVVRLGAT